MAAAPPSQQQESANAARAEQPTISDTASSCDCDDAATTISDSDISSYSNTSIDQASDTST
ncbi:MAG: hypothetical protein L6R39_006495, partial [Caloplaca ligustica]